MRASFQCKVNSDKSRETDPLLEELEEAALDPAQFSAIDGILRALTRSVLDASATMRFESIEPYERALDFAAGQVASRLADLDSGSVHQDTRYILGRIDGLLDACDMGIDRSVSGAVVEAASRRLHVLPILEQLHRQREMRSSELANAIQIERNHLSNILKWMEGWDMVRRSSVGRTSLVSWGPKARVVYEALQPGLPEGIQVDDSALVKSDSAYAESAGDLELAMAA